MSSIRETIGTMIEGHEAAWALATATREHKRIEGLFQRKLLSLCGAQGYLDFPHMRQSWTEHFQCNFFSILFLSVYKTLGIQAERRTSYGIMNQALRGIVTATDNILDGEDKGCVRLRLHGGTVLPNVMLILLLDGVLQQTIREVAADEAVAEQIGERLAKALLQLALEESAEEEGVEQALPVAWVLQAVHSLRGGSLLELAFVGPEANEPGLTERIAAARRGIHPIGLGLQILDDITDFAQDIEARNHNVLRSWVVHAGSDGPVTDYALSRMGALRLGDPGNAFPRSAAAVLDLAMNHVLDGFERLHRIGYPVGRDAATRLAAVLFRLRGLEHLWESYAERNGIGRNEPLPVPAGG